MVFLWEQNTAVNDENFAVDLEHGHVSTDFPDSAERNDSENPWAKSCWGWEGLNH
jgi:hypothetical protein